MSGPAVFYPLKTTWKALLVGAFLSSIGIVQAQRRPAWPHPTPDSSRAEILAELQKYYNDLSARDWKAYAAHFWPGATLTTFWQPPQEKAPRVVITTLSDFIAQTPQGPDSKPVFEERMLEADIRAYSDLAHVWARYKARFGDPGNVAEWIGVDAFTLMKHEGRWRIVSLSYTDEKSK